MKQLSINIKENIKLITMKIFQGDVCIASCVWSVNREKYMQLLERAARKSMKKAAKKLQERKSIYPFGFEYRRERKWKNYL